jgi:hypothetical protein
MYLPTAVLRGHLLRAQAVRTHGLAQLSFTLELPWTPEQGGAPVTVECLMAYGREEHAWAACKRAAANMERGQAYEAEGEQLRTAGCQMWLIGVSSWARVPGAIPPPPALMAVTHAALGIEWGDHVDARVAP